MNDSYPGATLIHLPLVDSTNNYAMQLMDAEPSAAGTTILADAQSGGKGQRGRTWIDAPGESLLMSTILVPELPVEKQFLFSEAVAVTIAEALTILCEDAEVRIKWPNDIIVNDRKAGGILIENVLRGPKWCYAVVGVGINVRQESFPESLPFATSLAIESGLPISVRDLANIIRGDLLALHTKDIEESSYLARYNRLLYKRGAEQLFKEGENQWPAIIRGVSETGLLEVELSGGEVRHYTHGSILWKWS